MNGLELQRLLADNIKKERKNKKFSQEKLAEEASMSLQMINDIEGCRRWPSEKTLTKISNALNVEVYTLFEPQKFSNQISKKTKKSIIEDINKIFENSVKAYLEQS